MVSSQMLASEFQKKRQILEDTYALRKICERFSRLVMGVVANQCLNPSQQGARALYQNYD